MKNKKKVSIIVPCYKVEEYLPRCLDTLMNQTLEDIEVICINDGSPDNCLKILKEYQKKYKDKLVIIDKENEGVWRGRSCVHVYGRGSCQSDRTDLLLQPRRRNSCLGF